MENMKEYQCTMYKLTNLILPEIVFSRYEMNDVVPITIIPAIIMQYQTLLANGCRKTL